MLDGAGELGPIDPSPCASVSMTGEVGTNVLLATADPNADTGEGVTAIDNGFVVEGALVESVARGGDPPEDI